MKDRKVVVQGGGENLYRISESNGIYTAYKINVNLISNSARNIGQTKNLEDALSLIKVHSGKEIKEVS